MVLPPRRFLPSLSLLAAFEAASRTGSVTAAAQGLEFAGALLLLGAGLALALVLAPLAAAAAIRISLS